MSYPTTASPLSADLKIACKHVMNDKANFSFGLYHNAISVCRGPIQPQDLHLKSNLAVLDMMLSGLMEYNPQLASRDKGLLCPGIEDLFPLFLNCVHELTLLFNSKKDCNSINNRCVDFVIA